MEPVYLPKNIFVLLLEWHFHSPFEYGYVNIWKQRQLFPSTAMVNIKNMSFAVDRRDGLTYGMSYSDLTNEEYTRTNQVQINSMS